MDVICEDVIFVLLLCKYVTLNKLITNKQKMMKKVTLLFAFVAFLSYVGISQSLTWQFANFEVVNSGTQLQFDVQVKASTAGTYVRDLQVYFDYNTAGFGSGIASSITVAPLTLMDNFYDLVNIADNTTSKIAIITEADNEMTQTGGAGGFNLMPGTFTGLFQVTMDITDNTATAGISFDEALMNGGQYYQSTSAIEPVKYTDPCLYSNDLLTDKLSVIYGSVTYAFNATLLNNTNIDLYDGSSTLVGNTLTDSNGDYNFNSPDDGAYTLESSSSKPWGGLNVADIFLTKMAAAGQTPPTWDPVMSPLAADVTDDGNVNVADVFMMQMKNANPGSTPPNWNVADFLFHVQNVTVTNGIGTISYEGICAGDVNGSYSPPSK